LYIILPQTTTGYKSDKMNNRGSIGISVVILLTSFMLISITISPIITGGITGTSKENMEEILDDVLDAISTYLQIKDVMGKYYSTGGEQRIEKVVLLIKPLLSQYNFEFSSISSLYFPPLPLLNLRKILIYFYFTSVFISPSLLLNNKTYILIY